MHIDDKIMAAMKQLPADLIRQDNGWSFDELAQVVEWQSVEDLAFAIKSTYAYIINRNDVHMYVRKVARAEDPAEPLARVVRYEQNKVAGSSDKTERCMMLQVANEALTNLDGLLKNCIGEIGYSRAEVIPYSPKGPVPDTGRSLNTFGPYQHAYDPAHECDLKLVGMWVDHVKDVVCAGNADLGEYVLNWFALLLQKPAKFAKSIVLRGEGAAACAWFVDVVMRYVVGSNVTETVGGLKRLTAQGSTAGLGKLLVRVDETEETVDDRSHRMFKHFVSDCRRCVKRQGSEWEEVADCANFVVVDHADSLGQFALPEEWRFVAVNVHGTGGGSEKKKEALMNMRAGRHLFHWLLQRDIGGFSHMHDQ